jgi:hypothetical protein
MRIPLAFLLLLLLATPGVQAGEPRMAVIPMFTQQIVLRQPPDWEVAYLYEDSTTSLAKFVPTDQSLFDWQEILSVEAYKGIATQSTYGPDTMLKAIQGEYASHCASPLMAVQLGAEYINGYDSDTMLLSCPALAEDFDGGMADEGTTGLYIAVKGRQDFYVIHYSTRSSHDNPDHPPITPQNYRDYLALIQPLLLCEPGDDVTACLAHQRPSRPQAK